jgi:16S rRNA A1518/A1519 N6-dimethyltransferase RsmA/KsgA/DIM1 with predicted DNA glycosylase/AP lyase activity
MNFKKAYGDFQTPAAFAERVTALVSEIFGVPDVVVEPTCGAGSFIQAAIRQWGKRVRYVGYEINSEYIRQLQPSLPLNGNAEILERDFFLEDWKHNFKCHHQKKVLVLGNPPWVTNAALSHSGIQNMPKKSNFQHMKGLDACTGNANFDIAEWMILQLLEALPQGGMLAMLCKTMTARKVLRHIWKLNGNFSNARLFLFNAKEVFDVSVDACLFTIHARISSENTAVVHEYLDLDSPQKIFGFVGGNLISDMKTYQCYQYLDKGSKFYIWRSGIKHDVSDVVELVREGEFYRNGFGEKINLEDNFIFPLLKSSDIGNGRVMARKCLLLPQSSIEDNLAHIRLVAPRTWDYLNKYAMLFSNRRSSIYRNRSQFSVFGIGKYSFAPWKVAVSGLYKTLSFVVVPPVEDRPTMLDDTCYSLACRNEEEARLICELLNSDSAISFLHSLIFMDSKRPITADILRRLSIFELARTLGRTEEFILLCDNRELQGDSQMALEVF